MKWFLRIFLVLGFIIGGTVGYANAIKMEAPVVLEMAVFYPEMDSIREEVRIKKKSVAIVLALTLGVFGVHRLYLGTSNKVPIIYTLTLGGGFGILMVSDIIAILATKDINTFSPSEKVFMWAE